MCHSLSRRRLRWKNGEKGRTRQAPRLTFFIQQSRRRRRGQPPAKLHKRNFRGEREKLWKIGKLIKFTSRDKGRHDGEVFCVMMSEFDERGSESDELFPFFSFPSSIRHGGKSSFFSFSLPRGNFPLSSFPCAALPEKPFRQQLV